MAVMTEEIINQRITSMLSTAERARSNIEYTLNQLKSKTSTDAIVTSYIDELENGLTNVNYAIKKINDTNKEWQANYDINNFAEWVDHVVNPMLDEAGEYLDKGMEGVQDIITKNTQQSNHEKTEEHKMENIEPKEVAEKIQNAKDVLNEINFDDSDLRTEEVSSIINDVNELLRDAEREYQGGMKMPIYKVQDVEARNEMFKSSIEKTAKVMEYVELLNSFTNEKGTETNTEQSTGTVGIPGVSLTQDEVDQVLPNQTSNVEQPLASETLTSEQVADEIQKNYDRVTSVPALEDLREQKDVLALEDLREQNLNVNLENKTETGMDREEPMFQQGASSYYDPERPLISRFMRYFDASMPSNSFQAIDFGKHIFRYMLPNDRIPQDSESLMNMTRLTLQQRDGFTDKDFVRLVIDKVNDNPGLITFDMVADLVESDAYKNYGTTSGSEFGRKQKFERWICDKSVLKKVEDPVVCTLHEDSMKRVAAAIMPEKDKEKYFAKIDGKIAEFEDVCAKKIREDKSLITQLEANTRQQGESGIRENALQKVRDMYGIICTPPFGALYGEKISTDDASKSTIAEKNIAASGHVAYANMTLEALAKRGAISQKDLQKVLIDELPFNDKTQSQPQLKKRGAAFYVADVLKTARSSFIGAAAFSILGKICPPAAGIAVAAMVVGGGFKAARDEYKKLDKDPEYTRLQKIRKAALKGTSAVVTKGIPAAAAVAFGPVVRVFGAAAVAVRSFVEDVEHRAGIQRQNQQALEENQNQLQQNEQGNQQRHKKGIKGFISDFVGGIKDKFNKTRENIKSLKGKDIGKSVAYGISKGIAMYFGAQAGIGVGNAIGDNLNTKITEVREQQANNMTTKEIVNENMKDVGDNLRKGGFDLDAQANPEGVEANLNNTQTPSYADKYIAEHPGAHYDENGWVRNADGSYPRNEDGQLFGNESRVFRDLHAHETLDSHGNIIDKPGHSSLSQNNTDINNEPPVNAIFEGRESLDEIQASRFAKFVNKGNYLLGNHNEQIAKEINRVDSASIRNEMLEYNADVMQDFRKALETEQANILEDGKVTWGESRKYTNMVKGFTSKHMQDITNAINNNHYDYEPSVNAQFSNPNLEKDDGRSL